MYIYCITNTLNDKKYIGQTYLDVQKRWGNHISKSRGGSELAIHRAIRKYGAENFKIELLDSKSISSDELNEAEIYHIACLDTFNGVGYNSCVGGLNTIGYKHTDETKSKISAALTGPGNGNFGKFGKNHPSYGKKHSEATIAKMSGKNHHSNGRVISDSTRKKLSQAMLRRSNLHDPLPWAWKPVNQIDKRTNKVIKTWESMQAAGNGTNTQPGAISCCCHKKPKYKTAGGFKWEFAV